MESRRVLLGARTQGRRLLALSACLIGVSGVLIAGKPGVIAPAPDSLDQRAAMVAALNWVQSRGWRVQDCQTTQSRGVTVTDCEGLSSASVALRSLDTDDFIWFSFEPGPLEMGELFRAWGRPDILRSRTGHVSLRWEWPDLDLAAQMYWGDPHSEPDGAVFTLERAGSTRNSRL